MNVRLAAAIASALIAAQAASAAGQEGTPGANSDWPSYNRSLESDRSSPLKAINHSNVAGLKTTCVFDTKEIGAFESGLVEVGGALFATTEHDTYSIDANSCALNWKATEAFKDSYLGAQRGVAVADGRVFRGARNGHVYAYDQTTGARLWDAVLADDALGESTPSAPITWKGFVFIGTAGGDNRGVKGRMYALDAATGKIVWEFFMVPKAEGDITRGPQAVGAAPAHTWKNATGVEITGGGTWTSYTLDPERGELYVPGGNPAPDFASHLRQDSNLYSGSVVVLDAASGAYKRHFSLVPEDFHDYDVSSAPVLLASRKHARLMAVTPKDGFLYVYDLDSGRRLHRVPVTTQFNTSAKLTSEGTRFCPGTQGGSEWNGPAVDSANDAVITGQVDWCSTVHMDKDADTLSVARAQAWTGSKDGFGITDSPDKWSGWVTSVALASGEKRWKFRAPNPVMGGVTTTAASLVFFGDMGGNFYALDTKTGRQLGQWKFDGAVGGGVITYDAGLGQRVAVATGLTSKIWPSPKVTSKVVVLATRQVP